MAGEGEGERDRRRPAGTGRPRSSARMPLIRAPSLRVEGGGRALTPIVWRRNAVGSMFTAGCGRELQSSGCSRCFSSASNPDRRGRVVHSSCPRPDGENAAALMLPQRGESPALSGGMLRPCASRAGTSATVGADGASPERRFAGASRFGSATVGCRYCVPMHADGDRASLRRFPPGAVHVDHRLSARCRHAQNAADPCPGGQLAARRRRTCNNSSARSPAPAGTGAPHLAAKRVSAQPRAASRVRAGICQRRGGGRGAVLPDRHAGPASLRGAESRQIRSRQVRPANAGPRSDRLRRADAPAAGSLAVPGALRIAFPVRQKQGDAAASRRPSAWICAAAAAVDSADMAASGARGRGSRLVSNAAGRGGSGERRKPWNLIRNGR